MSGIDEAVGRRLVHEGRPRHTKVSPPSYSVPFLANVLLLLLSGSLASILLSAWKLTLSESTRIPCRCGFSQKIVGILESEGIDYTTFDILQDEGVRQSACLFPSLPLASSSARPPPPP